MVFSDGTILFEPSNAELAEKLGINTKAQRQFYDTIIVGSGPTGLTAGLYMGRGGMDTLVIEKGGIGGQAVITQLWIVCCWRCAGGIDQGGCLCGSGTFHCRTNDASVLN